jgi:hypothetical protein
VSYWRIVDKVKKRKDVYEVSDVRRVSGQEVVACLLGRQFADGREHTECVTREHDDVAGLAVDGAGYVRIRDKLNRIRAACVFRDADIVIVGSPRCGVVNDVLEDTAKADSVVDLGLFGCGEVDGLGVAPALDVEDTSVRPDMLVVTDEQTPGSALRVVFPVPDKPKNSVTSPFSMPTLADECRDSCPNLTGWR